MFGVLSNDSDFLILDVKFFPISKFYKKRNGDFRFEYFEMTRNAKLLGLHDPHHFPIFSCMCGNDYTKLELVKFQNYKQVMGKLGNQVDRVIIFSLFCSIGESLSVLL